MSTLWGNIAFPKLSALWMEGSNCDVSIVCRNGTVKAPSVLLCAVSEKLQEVLQLSVDKELTFKETDVGTWTYILQTLYLGTIIFPTEDVGNGFMTLCSAMSFAYCLNIQAVLNLYQHAAHVDTNRQMIDLWDNFSLEDGLEVPLEFCHTETGTMTRYKTTFTTDNFIKLKDIIRKCHDAINLDCTDIEITRDKSTPVEKICIKCGMGKCHADQVRCVYCNESIDADSGSVHMEEKHLLSPSVIWPVSCQVDTKNEEKYVRGCRLLKNKFCEQSQEVIQTVVYQCLECSYTVEDIPGYINHFLTHGFFAQVCEFCGDAFSNEAISDTHSMFCGIKDKSAILLSGKTMEEFANPEEGPTKGKPNSITKVQEVVAATEDEDDDGNILQEIDSEDLFKKQSHSVSKFEHFEEGVKENIKGKCTECGLNCKNKRVQCLLCFKTVDNDVKHIFQSHPISRRANIWPYSCELKRDSKEMVVRLLENYSFECLLCQSLFADREASIFHLQDHRLRSVFFCKHCESGFKSAINRNSHQHFCGGGDYTQCRLCKLFFSTFDQLQQHQVKKHKHDTTMKSEVETGSPEKSVKRKKSLLVKAELGETPEEIGLTGLRDCKCMNCGSECTAPTVRCAYCYSIVENSERHMEEVHPFTPMSSSWVYNCRFLKKASETPQEWMVTAKVRVSSNGRSQKHSFAYDCLLCEQRFADRVDVVFHAKQDHKLNVNTCRVCESGFRSSRYLKDHEHFCSGGGLVECSLCNAIPGTFKMLGDHYRRHHQEEYLPHGEIHGALDGESGGQTANTSLGEEEEEGENDTNENAFPTEEQGEIVKYKNHTMFCTSCNGPCEALHVKCLYCFKLVENSSSHMSKFHAFTPEKSIWVVNCRYINTKVHLGDRWVVFMKEKGKEGSRDIFKCLRCQNKVFNSLALVKSHLMKVHNQKSKACRICHMGFMDGRYHKDHELFCSGGQPLSCQICKRKVGNYKNRSDHMRRTHNMASSSVLGEEQKIKHELSGNLEELSDLENEDSATEFAGSEKLEEVSVISSDRKRHHEKICTNCEGRCAAVKVKCMYCYQIVNKKSDHMATFHAFTPKSSVWVFSCRFKVTQARSLERWMIFRQEYDKVGEVSRIVFRCMRCNKQFSHLDSILNHVEKLHKIRAKVCSVCSMGFIDARYMKDHELFCSGGKPLSCNICGKMVGNQKHMKDHMRSHQGSFDSLKEEREPIEDNTTEDLETQNAAEKVGAVRESDGSDLDDAVEENPETDFAEDNVLTTTHKMNARQNMCGNCGEDNCKADTVKCLYCHDIVENDAAHMDQIHPYTPRGNAWIYTCRFVSKPTSCGKSLLLFMKRPMKKNESEGPIKKGSCVFKCMKCRILCPTKIAMVQHMTAKHRLDAYVCSICESGFSTLVMLREHRHFCCGGEVTTCQICDRLVGSLKALSDHMSKKHRGVAKRGMVRRKAIGITKQSNSKRPRLDTPIDSMMDPEIEENTDNETSGEDASLDDFETIDNLMENYFDTFEVFRNRKHVKVCINCHGDCTADTVKCYYCEDVVSSTNIATHMQEVHPWTPVKSLFPVTCKFVKHQAGAPEILARPNGEAEQPVKDPLSISSYTCEICMSDWENSKAVENHIQEFHNVKSGFCKTCGLCLKKSIQAEHQYFCSGGEMYECKPCKKLVGGRPHAILHRSRVHPINPKNKTSPGRYNPRTIDEEDLARISSKGEYGYTIISADCHCSGPVCTQSVVKCGLCHSIVEKNDQHMKLRHPYSPTNTWVVYCKYSLVSNQKTPRVTVGEKIPDASEEEILCCTQIPCDLRHVYKCCKCNQMFDNHYRLRCHLKGVHLESERLYTCKHCESFFCNMNSDTFANHVHLCKTGSLFTCDVCLVMCTTAKALYYHMLSNHPDEKRARQMEYKEERDEDMVVPEGTEVFCSECDYKTTVVLDLRDHMRGKHGYRCARLNQVCKHCFKMFKTRSIRERHEQEEHVTDGKKHLCEICGKEFDIPYQLKTHMYYFHRGGREMASLRKKIHFSSKSEESSICPYCGNLYKSLRACKQHIKHVHMKSSDWICRFCNRLFASKSTLQIHEDRHQGKKSYSCPYCVYVAYTGHNVNKHVEKNHPGAEKPYGMKSLVSTEEPIATNVDMQDVADLSTQELPVTIINNLGNVKTESLTLEPVEAMKFSDNVASFQDPESNSIVQYFVIKQ